LHQEVKQRYQQAPGDSQSNAEYFKEIKEHALLSEDNREKMIETDCDPEQRSHEKKPWGRPQTRVEPISSQRSSTRSNDKGQTEIHILTNRTDDFGPRRR